METRQILIANNKTQRRYNIQTAATTLGELKAELNAQGIDYSGMTFTEGISKLQLVNDDSLLPTNVMYKGQPTNNLVMLLTNSNKQIASGAISRKDAYALIKQLNLADYIKVYEGDNYTRVKTEALEYYINQAQLQNNNTLINEVRQELNNLNEDKACADAPKSELPDVKSASHANTINWFYDGIKAMNKDNQLFTDDIIVLANLLKELALRLLETKQDITDDDIDDMFASL